MIGTTNGCLGSLSTVSFKNKVVSRVRYNSRDLCRSSSIHRGWISYTLCHEGLHTIPKTRAVLVHFFPASMASPFLQAIILILGAETISLPSILNEGFFTMKVQTSSHNLYVCRWPYTSTSESWTRRFRDCIHTFRFVFVFTCFTIVSASDLSN